MPLYEYRCRTCDRSFDLLRPVRDADESAECPGGHDDTVRALSLVAPAVRGRQPVASGGGCCGGACGCGS